MGFHDVLQLRIAILNVYNRSAELLCKYLPFSLNSLWRLSLRAVKKIWSNSADGVQYQTIDLISMYKGSLPLWRSKVPLAQHMWVAMMLSESGSYLSLFLALGKLVCPGACLFSSYISWFDDKDCFWLPALTLLASDSSNSKCFAKQFCTNQVLEMFVFVLH